MQRSPARPTVSVVIPARDDALELEFCLEALARQTDPPDEIIVVDNDSSDLTPVVAARWGARCILESEVGIPAAAGTGYDAATGDVIARLDTDSNPPEDWVARLRTGFSTEPRPAAITGPGRFPELSPGAARLVDALYMRSYFALFERIIRRPPVFGSNFAMTREAWRYARPRIHRHGVDVHDDLDLSFHLPDAPVLLDRTLQVDVSARPFHSASGMLLRIVRGFRTYAVNRSVIRSAMRERLPHLPPPRKGRAPAGGRS